MRVVVPFAAESPKTRLETVLDADERYTFASTMLADVMTAIRRAGHEPEVLATTSMDVGAAVTVDDRPLTPAVNGLLAEAEQSVAVIAADLAIATPTAIERLFMADGDVVIAPGRAGGTNALVVRRPDFRVDYHGASFLDHRRIAADLGATFTVIDSHRLATDIDTRADLVEVLLHGEGESRTWLVDAGFELAVEAGRVGLRRS